MNYPACGVRGVRDGNKRTAPTTEIGQRTEYKNGVKIALGNKLLLEW